MMIVAIGVRRPTPWVQVQEEDEASSPVNWKEPAQDSYYYASIIALPGPHQTLAVGPHPPAAAPLLITEEPSPCFLLLFYRKNRRSSLDRIFQGNEPGEPKPFMSRSNFEIQL
jgi:hypothetical protein